MKAKWSVPDGVEGFGFEPRKLPPEKAARWAVEKHEEYLNNGADLKLLLVPIGKKKDRKIVRFLYGNASATIKDLWELTEDEPLTLDALRKTIDRLNRLFSRERIPLKIVKERGSKHGRERVWLDVCN